MKKTYILLSLLTAVLVVIACKKNKLWVGNKEYIEITYSNSETGPKVSSASESNTKFTNVNTISATNVGEGVIEIVLDGVRVESKRNNFEIKSDGIKVYEKRSSDSDRDWEEQSEFNSVSSSSKTDIACVLVLDMSTSLLDVMDDLKTYAKDFVDQIASSTSNSYIAIVFFSGKNDIESTDFFNVLNADSLKKLIDNYSNHKDRTALFQAAKTGIKLLDDFSFAGPKSMVIFTDGGDNDTDNPDQVKAEIRSSEYFRVSIGLNGEDFIKDDVKDIASNKSNYKYAKNAKKLKATFDAVARQIASVYKITYNRSDQLINDVNIRFEFEVDKVK